MASDSDNDAGTSIASDPGTHGPPCRIAAVATAQQRKPHHPPPPAASAIESTVNYTSPLSFGILHAVRHPHIERQEAGQAGSVLLHVLNMEV